MFGSRPLCSFGIQCLGDVPCALFVFNVCAPRYFLHCFGINFVHGGVISFCYSFISYHDVSHIDLLVCIALFAL